MSEVTLMNLIKLLSDIIAEMSVTCSAGGEQQPYYHKFFAVTDMVDSYIEMRRTCWELLDMVEEHEDEYGEELISEEQKSEIESLLR